MHRFESRPRSQISQYKQRVLPVNRRPLRTRGQLRQSSLSVALRSARLPPNGEELDLTLQLCELQARLVDCAPQETRQKFRPASLLSAQHCGLADYGNDPRQIQRRQCLAVRRLKYHDSIAEPLRGAFCWAFCSRTDLLYFGLVSELRRVSATCRLFSAWRNRLGRSLGKRTSSTGRLASFGKA